MKWLIGFSLRQSSLVVFAAAVLVVWAGVQLPHMPVDVFPELNAPTVTILTEAGGLAADEVEQLVTFPIEASMSGLPGIRRVRSASASSLSIVWVEFEWGEDIYRARQLVAEKIASVEESLPREVHAEIGPISSITGEIMLIALSSPDGSVPAIELRAAAEFEIRNRLLGVPGIAQVVAIGGYLPEYAINVEPTRLLSYDLEIEDIVQAARESHTTVSAGFLSNVKGLEVPLRQSGRVRSADDIRRTVVSFEHDTPVRLGDVASVELAGAPRRGAAGDSGEPAVVLSIQKSPGTNTLELTRRVDAELDALEKSLPNGVHLNRYAMRQADFIENAVSNVTHKLVLAAIVTALVLAMFLMDARTTLVTLVALPLSIAVALLILRLLDMTINVMTLGGLAVAVGELVDDAIIDVENVYRRLRQNIARPPEQQRKRVDVIFDASNEIRSSVVFATLIIVIVFLPLLFLEGLEGRFFRPLAAAYVVSILASLLVAMTVTPALCKWLMRGGSLRAAKHGSGILLRFLEKLYAPVLRFSIRRRKLVGLLALLAIVVSLVLGTTFGSSFLPEFNEGTITVFLMAPPGTSIDSSDRMARGIEKQIGKIRGVRTVVRRTGRAERDEHAEPPSNSEIDITLDPDVPKAAVRDEIDRVLASTPGITTMVGQPIEHRLSHVMSGTPAAIAIDVFGDDLDELRAIVANIESALMKLPGARDVAANRELMVTTLPIQYRPQELARWGLTPAHAAEQVSTGFYGTVADVVNDGVRRYDIVVRIAEDQRQTIGDVRKFMLHGASGQMVRLEEVADIGPERVSNLIARENTQRKATVSCNVADGYNLGQLVKQVQSLVDPIVEKQGYTVRYGGQFEAQQAAGRTILFLGVGVIVLILMMLQSAFGSMRAALLVLVNLPLALIGGIVAVFLAESPSVTRNLMSLLGLSSERYIAPVISIASLVGFVTLFGIAVRNGILLVNHYRYLIDNEGMSVTDAVVRGSIERLSPILMTASTAMLALLPVALAGSKPGGELLAPLAVVVLGGLVSSTLLNLVVVPAGYVALFARQGERN